MESLLIYIVPPKLKIFFCLVAEKWIPNISRKMIFLNELFLDV